MNEQEKYDWMVHVRCMTYNHAPYIEDALNGFTMQETNFPFVCAIVDDASTDGEQEVIKNYLNEHFDLEDKSIVRHEETDDYVLTFARHKTNLNCHFVVFYLKYNHYNKKSIAPYLARWRDKVKYIAMCEGDDYWIDSHKLQKQYNILEKDNGISMCHHNFYEQIEKGERTLKVRNVPMRQDIISIAKNNTTQTVTMFFRNIKPLVPNELKGRQVYSQFWTLRLAEFGDIFYINEPMVVYRRNSNSIYGTQSSFRKFSMAIINLDNMIYWMDIRQRLDVLSILKRRSRNTCLKHLLYFFKKMEFKHALFAINKLVSYYR